MNKKLQGLIVATSKCISLKIFSSIYESMDHPVGSSCLGWAHSWVCSQPCIV